MAKPIHLVKTLFNSSTISSLGRSDGVQISDWPVSDMLFICFVTESFLSGNQTFALQNYLTSSVRAIVFMRLD